MKIVFVLSMPGNNSWNGKWSGEGDCYAVIRTVSNAKKHIVKYLALLEKRHFSYNFGDGWRASIEVFEPTPTQVRQYRKISRGFCGYDWMIDTILAHGEIRCDVKVEENGKRRKAWQTSGNGEVHFYEPSSPDSTALPAPKPSESRP